MTCVYEEPQVRRLGDQLGTGSHVTISTIRRVQRLKGIQPLLWVGDRGVQARAGSCLSGIVTLYVTQSRSLPSCARAELRDRSPGQPSTERPRYLLEQRGFPARGSLLPARIPPRRRSVLSIYIISKLCKSFSDMVAVFFKYHATPGKQDCQLRMSEIGHVPIEFNFEKEPPRTSIL